MHRPSYSPILSLLAATCVGLIATTVAAEPKWNHEYDADGISVWSQEIPGRDLPVYRATGVLDENLYEILAVFNDFSRHHEWMRNMAESRVIWRPDDFNLIMYSRFDSPWPVWDRDTIMEVQVDLDRARQEVTMNFARIELQQLPVLEDVVRVPSARMFARMRYIDATHTEIVLEMDVDPAGDLPRWLVRWLSKQVPVDALEQLKIQIDETRGQYADFIRKYDPQYGRTAALPLATGPDA